MAEGRQAALLLYHYVCSPRHSSGSQLTSSFLSYDACSSTLQYLVDSHPHLELTLVPVRLAYPVSHADVLRGTEEAIKEANKAGGGKIRLALVDAISSNPGVVVPWEELVKLYRSEGILRCVAP